MVSRLLQRDMSTLQGHMENRNFLRLGFYVAVAHTAHGDNIHLISIRKATKHEARQYLSQIFDQALPSAKDDRRRHSAPQRRAGMDS
jgi:hypothetical protein